MQSIIVVGVVICNMAQEGQNEDPSRQSDQASDGIERLAKRGNLTSDNHRDAITCDDCRTTWYGHTNPFNTAGATVATEYCPYCGGGKKKTPGGPPFALILNPAAVGAPRHPLLGGGADG